MPIRSNLNPPLIISWLLFLIVLIFGRIKLTSAIYMLLLSILLFAAIFLTMIKMLSLKFEDARINGKDIGWRDLPIHILGLIGIVWYSAEVWNIILQEISFHHFIFWEVLKLSFLILFIVLERDILFEDFTLNPLTHRDIQDIGNEMREQLEGAKDDNTKALFEWLYGGRK